jgi:hypothetical protein
MKRVVLITAHFPPSNLVGVHRARIWSQYLPEFGWQPTILTSHWKHYEESLDWGLMDLIDPELEVIHTKAFGTKPVRLLGNMALRAMLWSRRALDELLTRHKIDFVHIIVPDHFSALLGPRIHRKYGVPYGIDYSDPWVHDSPRSKKLFSKAWVSCCLSYLCEPWAIRHARLITGVSPLYYAEVFARNPLLQRQSVTAAIPMASPERDFDAVSNGYVPKVRLFDPSDGNYHLLYAGAMWPKAQIVLERFLQAIRGFLDEEEGESRLRVTFVGTGRSPNDSDGHNIAGSINRLDLSNHVVEYPARIDYLDVLWHLKAASGILILGSTEQHYTPSKVFQAVQSRNPVLALLHKRSTATKMLRDSGAGMVVDVPESGLLDAGELKRALRSMMSATRKRHSTAHPMFEADSARAGTKRLAEALEAACLS